MITTVLNKIRYANQKHHVLKCYVLKAGNVGNQETFVKEAVLFPDGKQHTKFTNDFCEAVNFGTREFAAEYITTTGLGTSVRIVNKTLFRYS